MMTQQSQRLLEAAFPSIQRVASYLAYVHHSRRLDAAELTQIGALAVCEAMRRGIHPDGDETAYIVGTARRAMEVRLGVYRRQSGSRRPAVVLVSLESLDQVADAAVEAADDYAAYECYEDSLPGEEVQA